MKHFASVGFDECAGARGGAGGARGGVWVADEQTAGRGRGGHSGTRRAGEGLYVSALMTPAAADDDGAVALAGDGAGGDRRRSQRRPGWHVDIRWPNDLMIERKKCGGILVETAAASAESDAPAMLRYAVIGVGINLNHACFPAELERLATSLRIASGEQVRARDAAGGSAARAGCRDSPAGSRRMAERITGEVCWSDLLRHRPG